MNVRLQARDDNEVMAKTKGKPGPKPKYGEREEIHVMVPVDDLNYIRSVTSNTTEWVIQAIQEKRHLENQRITPPPAAVTERVIDQRRRSMEAETVKYTGLDWMPTSSPKPVTDRLLQKAIEEAGKPKDKPV